jgi:hypothetical protein
MNAAVAASHCAVPLLVPVVSRLHTVALPLHALQAISVWHATVASADSLLRIGYSPLCS